MSCQKRKFEEEKEKNSPGKRTCLQNDSTTSPHKKSPDQQLIRNTQIFKETERKRILEILEAEFDKELKAKEEEVIEIQERIHKTQRILQYLCYAVVADFYSREKTITSVASTRQRRIHPAVKKLLSGKGPPGAPEFPQNISIPAEYSAPSSSKASSVCSETADADVLARVDSPSSCDSFSSKEKKVPRYIPPKPKPKPIVGNQSEPVRGGQNKVKTILVVGNVSKWLPLDMRDDSASHKWMVYVRGPKGHPDISSFVSKVRFFLHPSYRPNDVVQVVCPPFHLSRRGWGEFPIRVQVHFSNSLNKPVDIIHNLKLDRTHCGLQTLGSETVAEVWIHREQPQTEVQSEVKSDQKTIKLELDNFDENSMAISEETHVSASSSLELSNLCGSIKVESTQSTQLESSHVTTENTQHLVSQLKHEEDPLVQAMGLTVKTEPLWENELALLNVSARNQVSSFKNNVMSPEVMKKAEVKSSPLSPSTKHSPTKRVVPSGTTSSIHTPQVSPARPILSSGTTAILQTSQVSPAKAVAFSGSTCSIQTTQVSPAKPVVSSGTTTSAIQTTQVSPAKPVVSSGITTSAIQTTLVSPAKTGTQLVKCIDSKGMVRLLQVRTDLLPKILKRGSTTIPATPPSNQEASSSINSSQTINTVPPTISEKAVQQTEPPKTMSTPVLAEPVVCKTISQPQTTIPQVILGAPKAAITSPLKVQGAQTGISIPQGVRPVLRFVRPPGNIARPMLVAPNATSQQIIRLPASAASAGNRPLYVLKDGKLFMMKSALNAAAAAASATTKVTPPISSSNSTPANKDLAENLLKKTETAQGASSTMLKTTATEQVRPSTTSKDVSVVLKTPDVKLSDTVLVTSRPNLALNAGVALKPKQSSLIPKIASAGDAVVQTVNKTTLAQQFPLPQSVSSPTIVPKAVSKSGKSLLKPAVSLLKSNVGTGATGNNVSKTVSIPSNNQSLLKISTPSRLPLPAVPVVEGFSTTKRIVLGRTSGSSTITTYSQQALVYREMLRSTIQACPKGPEEDVWRAVRWMVKHLPLINPEARNLEFKILHPYCAPDEKTFCSWNIGKQRACEWQRAKTVRHLLKETGWNLQNLWTTREILLWARFHGFTPGLPVLKNRHPGNILCGRDGGCENPMAVICNYGKISALEEWSGFLEKPSPLPHASQPPELVSLLDESDEEIDIISTNSPLKVKVKQEPDNFDTLDTSEKMSLDPSLHTLSEMVTRSLNNIGIHLSSQEIVPGVQYPAAQRMLIQAVQSLAEDLARRAFADAWGKDNITRQPGSIEISNICSAICHRPEFDIFTCAGLGISSISDSLPSEK